MPRRKSVATAVPPPPPPAPTLTVVTPAEDPRAILIAWVDGYLVPERKARAQQLVAAYAADPSQLVTTHAKGGNLTVRHEARKFAREGGAFGATGIVAA